MLAETHAVLENENQRSLDERGRHWAHIASGRRVRVSRAHVGIRNFQMHASPVISDWVRGGWNASIFNFGGGWSLNPEDCVQELLRGENMEISLVASHWGISDHKLIDFLASGETGPCDPYPQFESCILKSSADLVKLLKSENSRCDALFLRFVRFTEKSTSTLHLVSLNSSHAISSVTAVIEGRGDAKNLFVRLLAPLVGGNCRVWVVGDFSEVENSRFDAGIELLESAYLLQTECFKEPPAEISDFKLIGSEDFVQPKAEVYDSPEKRIADSPSPLGSFLGREASKTALSPVAAAFLPEHHLALIERVTETEIALHDAQLENRRLLNIIGGQRTEHKEQVSESYEAMIDDLNNQLLSVKDENARLLLAEYSDPIEGKKVVSELRSLRSRLASLEKEKRLWLVGKRAVDGLTKKLHAAQIEVSRLSAKQTEQPIKPVNHIDNHLIYSENEYLKKVVDSLTIEVNTMRQGLIDTGKISLATKFILPDSTESDALHERGLTRLKKLQKELAFIAPQILPEIGRVIDDLSFSGIGWREFRSEAYKMKLAMDRLNSRVGISRLPSTVDRSPLRNCENFEGTEKAKQMWQNSLRSKIH